MRDFGGGHHEDLAKRLAEHIGGEVVSLSKFRYGPEWKRRRHVDFLNILSDTLNGIDGPIVTTGSTLDGNNGDEFIMDRLGTQKRILERATMVIILKPKNKLQSIEKLIKRTMERANGDREGAHQESAKNIAQMVLKHIEGYDEVLSYLDEMEEFVKKTRPDLQLFVGDPDDIGDACCDALNLQLIT